MLVPRTRLIKKMRAFTLPVLIFLLGSCSEQQGSYNWIEPNKEKYAHLNVEWLSTEDFFLIDDREQNKAVELLEKNTLRTLSREEFNLEFPVSGAKNDVPTEITIARAASSENGSTITVGIYKDEIFSIVHVLGGCVNLENKSIAIRSKTSAKRARVVCAATI